MAELRLEQPQAIHQLTAFARRDGRRVEQDLQFGFELRDVLPELFDMAIHRMAHGRLRGLTTCRRHPLRLAAPRFGYVIRKGLVKVFRRRRQRAERSGRRAWCYRARRDEARGAVLGLSRLEYRRPAW